MMRSLEDTVGNSSRWIGWGFGIVFVAAAIGTSVWIYTNRTDATVRGELARIAAEGSPITMEDLAGKKIPDSTNGALIYEKAFALLPGKGSKDMDLLSRALSADDPIKTQADWDSLRKALAKYPAVVPLAEQAQSMPDCRFPVDWSVGALNATFPHLSNLRNLCRVVCAQAVLNARDGKPADSLKLLGLAFKMSDSLGHDQTLIHFMVRVAIIKIASHSLRECLAYGGVAEQDALRLSTTLAKISISDGPSEALKTERAMGIWIFDKIQKEGPGFLGGAVGSTSQPSQPMPNGVMGIGGEQEELYYLKKMREYIETARMPYREAVASGREIGEPSDMPKNAIICAIVFPVFGRVVVSRDCAQAELDGSRIALALSVYHSQHKAYPASLNEVSGFFGGKMPLDPFTGKPFVYSSWTKGYLLYSIGGNLKDDGGKPGRGSDEGDIVWSVR